MDGAHTAAGSGCSEAGGASSASSCGGGSESRFRLHKGVHLRRRRRVAVGGGGSSNKGGAGDGGVQDLALPLGMSFAAVLAQVSWVLGLFLLLVRRRPKDSIFTLLVRTAGLACSLPSLGHWVGVRLGMVSLQRLLL